MFWNYPPEKASEIRGKREKIREIAHAARIRQARAWSATPWASPSIPAEETMSSPLPTSRCCWATWAWRCGGVNPLRGQNNVQGACDMGALPNVYPGLSGGERSRMNRENLKRPGASPAFPTSRA